MPEIIDGTVFINKKNTSIPMLEWIEANIFYTNNPSTILLELVKPFITALENTEELCSFHIFREPGPRILLRIFARGDSNEIRNRIRSWEAQENISRIQFRDYNGEENSFGVDAWITTYKFLEALSRVCLDILDDSVEKGENFNINALNHYFLNICGLSIPEEAVKHFEMVIGRLYAQRYYDLREINGKMQSIESRLQDIEDSLNRNS